MIDPLEQLPKRVQSVEEKLDSLATSVDTRFDAVDARFDRVDARLDRMDARFDGVDARLATVDERFDEVTSALVEQRQYTEFAFQQLRGEMHAGFSRLERKLDMVIDRIDRAPRA